MSGGAAHYPAWRAALDATLVKYFGLTLEEAGADDVVLQQYADLEGSEAAVAFADDYELARLDWWSWGRCVR